MTTQENNYVYKLGQRVANATNFPVIEDGGAGMQRISIPPGHLLTPHWHPNSNETTYCLEGNGEVALVLSDPSSGAPIGANFQKYAFEKEDIVFLPQGCLHYFQNTGTTNLVILLTFDNPDFDILTLADALEQLPSNITVAASETVGQAGSSPVIPYSPE